MQEVISSLILIIAAINPGYTVDGVQNINDFVEIRNVSGHELSLTGVSLRYNDKIIYQFDGFGADEGSILLKYSASPNNIEADAQYTSNLAMDKGLIELWVGDEVVDSICWGSEGCMSKFTLAATQTRSLVRCIEDDCETEWSYILGYEPEYGALRVAVNENTTDDEPSADSIPTAERSVTCGMLRFSEILTYYVDSPDEQFIELYNTSDETADLDGCFLRYKNKTYAMSGLVAPKGYYLWKNLPVTLTKNPSTENLLEIVDKTGKVWTQMAYPSGQKKGLAYALVLPVGEDEYIWLSTYRSTPGAANIYQEFRDCPSGKVINTQTGNCVNIPVVASVIPCPEGKYRNPETGRCKNIEVAKSTECPTGQERNPETGRCRTIKDNQGAGFTPVQGAFSNKTAFVGMGALIATITLCAGYAVFQYRKEIAKIFKRFWGWTAQKIGRRPAYEVK